MAMPSDKALRYALETIENIPFSVIAPQHGSVMNDQETINLVIDRLKNLEKIGIDGIVN